MRLLFLALMAFALPAAAQAPAPPAAEKSAPAEKPPAQKPAAPLILRLDQLDGPRMSFGPSATEKPPTQELPSLGGEAKPLRPSTAPQRTGFPKDATPGY